jgi:hypothetical protein
MQITKQQNAMPALATATKAVISSKHDIIMSIYSSHQPVTSPMTYIKVQKMQCLIPIYAYNDHAILSEARNSLASAPMGQLQPNLLLLAVFYSYQRAANRIKD